MNPFQEILDINPLVDILTDLPIYGSGYRIGASLLEPLFAFANEPGYQPYWIAVPQVKDLPLVQNQVFEDSFSIPAGSWLYALSYGSQRSAGFKFNLYDTGRRAWLFNRDGLTTAAAGGAGSNPQPMILPEPWAILGATLNVVLTNLDTTTETNDMQLLLWLAVTSEVPNPTLYPGIDPATNYNPLTGKRIS